MNTIDPASTDPVTPDRAASDRHPSRQAACRRSWTSTAGLLLALLLPAAALAEPGPFVRVSPRDSRYLEWSDGRPYIPIGLNLIHPNTADHAGLARMEEWLDKLSRHDGNFIRIWLSSPFWDVEQTQSGVYDETKGRRLDALLEMASQRGICVKLTLEHFREMSDSPRQRWANKPIHLVAQGGPAIDMADFFTGEAGRAQFRRKIAWFADRHPNHPAIFGWELWNEINAVRAPEESYLPWTEVMLAELRRQFPHHLAMQSLGSFDTDRVRDLYGRHSRLSGNDLAQVHRYLDLGAPLEICHGPMDVLVADAIAELLAFNAAKPILLAEGGAVEPRHTGPFKLYAADRDGILLHDVLFAAFFAGAAGPGQIWHWDVYVDRNHLWHHFARFAEAVRDLDPPAERFTPIRLTHPRLRLYALKGERTLLIWCRDAASDWRTELEQGQPPGLLEQVHLDLEPLLGPSRPVALRTYDPWQNGWQQLDPGRSPVPLPPFRRSIVVRATLSPP